MLFILILSLFCFSAQGIDRERILKRARDYMAAQKAKQLKRDEPSMNATMQIMTQIEASAERADPNGPYKARLLAACESLSNYAAQNPERFEAKAASVLASRRNIDGESGSTGFGAAGGGSDIGRKMMEKMMADPAYKTLIHEKMMAKIGHAKK
jgi:hypothetical protein